MLQAKLLTLNLSIRKSYSLEVMADEVKLQQVVGNLLQNAIKFTSPGGTITLACREADKDRVEISVTDNGPGIPGDELPHIFNKFYRGKSVAREIGGSWVGAIHRKRIDRAASGDHSCRQHRGEGDDYVNHAFVSSYYVEESTPVFL